MNGFNKRLIATKAYNPCPVCGDISGDCRIRSDNLVLCHSFIEQDSGIGSYKFLKTADNGVWGVHVPDDGKGFNQEQYQRYKELKEEELRDKKQFLADNALDAEERDKAIRKLSNYVGLKERDRKDLRRRGLSDRQIEAGLFFSIEPWTRFNIDLPDNLPGIHYRGDRFSTRDTGYACPIFDEQGRVIGWQIRVAGVKKGNKYKWAKSNFPSHLPNGELPITIVNPPTSGSKTLYLSEGSLKPYIAASRLNLPFCGAASGYFSGSPQQFRNIQQDFDEFVITPDAGDVVNRQVMKRWEKQIDFLEQFNKPIQILWWGQIEKRKHEKKKDQDIDEINVTTFIKAKYLTPQEFFALGRQQQWIQNNWKIWQIYKTFTAHTKIDKRYVKFKLPGKDVILFIKSALGTGKTTQLIKILEQLPDHGILNQGYRNTLLLQFNEKASHLSFYHLQSDKTLREFSLDDPCVRVSNCIDSLIHYVKEHFDGKIVILDEVVSVIKHLLYSRTIKNFEKVKELFSEMVKRAERIICLDGFMQDWVVRFFEELCPGKKIATLENVFQGDKPQIYLLEGSIDIDENIKVNDKAPLLARLFSSPLPAIFSDSQVFCEALDNLLQAEGYSGIRVDSKTVSSDEVKLFLKNPDLWITENKPQYFIGSPSVESGLDVSIKDYFSEHFLFFFGQLDTDSCIQMLGRIRDSAVPKYIWCKKFISLEEINRPCNMEAVEADRARRLMAEMSLVFNDKNLDSPEAKLARMQQIHQENLDPYSTAADTIKAIHNLEFPNLRDCLKEQLIAHGYPVESIILESTAQQQAYAKKEREAKTEVKQQNALDIFNASDKYIGQHLINLNFDANWETRCAVFKAKLVNLLPGINESSVWSPEFIKFTRYDKPNLIQQTDFYHLLKNPDLAEQLTLKKYNKIFNRGSIAAPWKLRQDYSKVIALIDVGIDDFLTFLIDNPGFTYNEDTPEVKEILKKCRYPKNRDILGNPGKKPLKYLNKHLRSVGAEIKCHQDRDKKDGTRHRNYSLNHKSWLRQERLAISKAIELKYEIIIKQENQELEWVVKEGRSQDAPLNSSGFKNQAQTVAQHSLDPVTDEPLFYINNSPNCDKKSNQDSLVNSSPELDNITKVQDSKGSPEIADLAQMLSELEDASELAVVRTTEGFTPDKLNQAWLLLDAAKRRQIANWAKQTSYEWDEVIEQINQQIKRVGGTIQYWKEYLLEKYNVASRLLLSDEQIIEFWNYLTHCQPIKT